MRTRGLAGALLVLMLTTPAFALGVGDKAPDFTLMNPAGKPVTLAELRAKGPVIIYTFISSINGL